MTTPSLPSLLSGHWQLAWPLDAAALGVVALYARASLRLRGRWPLRRTAAFTLGVAVVVVALQSGLDVYGERLLSVHMEQHMLLMLLAPLLLLAGQPLLLALRALPSAVRPALARALTRTRHVSGPVACLALSSGLLLLVHVPAIFDAALRHPVVHLLEHALLLGTGLALWWPLVGVDPARRLGALARIGYLLATMPAMALLGAYVNRAPAPLYQGYAAWGRVLGISAVADQQRAGAIMWVLGSSFVIAVGLWLLMAGMLSEERRLQAREQRLQAREEVPG